MSVLAIVPAAVTFSMAPQAQASTLTTPTIVSGDLLSGVMNKCLDNINAVDPALGTSNPIEFEPCNGNPGGQLWTVEADGTIRMWGQCLNVHSGTGPDVELFECNGTASEQWVFKTSGTLFNPQANKCLDTLGQATASGTQMVVDDCDATRPTEQWTQPTDNDVNQAASAIISLLNRYDFSNNPTADASAGMFVNPSGHYTSCTTSSGNCWWWSANALYSVVDFMDQAGSGWKGFNSVLSQVIDNTYSDICAGGCPNSTNFTTKTDGFQNSFFDDTGNWALTWLNAYELTVAAGSANNNYLYLAENLWYYITNNGWDTTSTCGAGGVFQTAGGNKNLGTNALYLRLSAWLYTVTGNAVYKNGISGVGGATAAASWLIGTSASPGALADLISGTSIDASGARLLFNGEITTSTCTVPTGQMKETQHMGQVLGALAAIYNVTSNTFYLHVGDNLAETIFHDTLVTSTPDAGVYTTPPFIDSTTAGSGELSETCTPPTHTDWPANCDISTEPWVPGKGILMRGLYCLNQALTSASLTDSAIGTFITANASTLWSDDQNAETASPGDTNLNNFGFVWDDFDATTLGYASQLSALDGLAAAIGSATTMC